MVVDVDEYVKILKNHDMKITPQRIAILRYIHTHHTHPSAETIYTALKKNNPSLSKTTIYNSLDLLREHGLVQALRLGATVRYDYNIDHHHHFYCKHCGGVIDIQANMPCWQDMVGDAYRIDDVHVYLKGVCPTCLKREEKI
jgi:Fe2+ or Zn2+ uptake regulation protein